MSETELESLRAEVASLKEQIETSQGRAESYRGMVIELENELASLKEQNALLTKGKPNELISALKQAYLVIYKLYEHYDSSEKAYGFAETLATIDKALANYATHSGVAVQEPVATFERYGNSNTSFGYLDTAFELPIGKYKLYAAPITSQVPEEYAAKNGGNSGSIIGAMRQSPTLDKE